MLALLAALPAIIARYPQMTDYPAHLARWHVMLDGGRSPVLAQYYGFRWAWSGNLGADLLIWPLSALFGLETGGRLIVILIPALTGLGLVAAERALRGRTGIGAVLAMATIWSPALLLGFLNFALSLALALLAFAGWVRWEGRAWRGALFVPIGLAVWLCHQSGWGVLGIMVFAYEWARNGNPLRAGLGHAIRAALATMPLWLPLVPTVLAGAEAGGSFNYGPMVMRVKWLHWQHVLRDRVEWLDLAAPVLFGLLALAAMLTRRFDWRVGIAALLLAALSLAVPRHLGGGDYADYRLTTVSLMLFLLAIDWRPRAWGMALAALPFAVRLAVTASAWQVHSAETAQQLAALDHIPAGAKVASAVRERLAVWPLPLGGHIAAYATVRRDALTNANFAVPGVHMLELRAPGWRWNDPSHRFLTFGDKRVALATFAPAAQADVLWYVGDLPPENLPDGAVVIWRGPRSLLARLRPAGAATEGAAE